MCLVLANAVCYVTCLPSPKELGAEAEWIPRQDKVPKDTHDRTETKTSTVLQPSGMAWLMYSVEL